MKIPTLVLSPIESRDRQGVVTPTVEGVVDTSYDSWHLWKGLDDPVLLVSPEGSFDRSGPVSPSVSDGLTEIDGQYGKAWHRGQETANVTGNLPSSTDRTVILRGKYPEPSTAVRYIIETEGRIVGKIDTDIYVNQGGGSQFRLYGAGIPTNEFFTLAYTDNVTTLEFFVNGSSFGQKNGSSRSGSTYRFPWSTNEVVEGVVFYDRILTQEEIARVSNMGRRWTWGNNAKLSSSASMVPFSVAVRYQAGLEVITEQVVLNGGIGSFGNNQIKYDFDNNTLSITTETDVKLYGIAAYEEELTSQEMEALSNVDEWTWAFLMPRVGGVIRTDHSQVEVPEDHIGALPTMLAPLEGDLEVRDRHGVATMTYSGALRWVDGPRTERKKVSPLLVASPDRTEDRQGPLTPHLSSSVTLGQGQYGRTWKIKKANTPKPTFKFSPSESRDQAGGFINAYDSTENLLKNPSLENGWGFWARLGVSTSLALSTEHVTAGNNSLLIETSGTGAREGIRYTEQIPAQVGDVFTFSFDVFNASEKEVKVDIGAEQTYGTNGYAGTSSSVSLPIGKSRQTVTVMMSRTDTYGTLPYIRTTVAAAAKLYIDALQFEKKPYATPYVDGDMPEGTWTGTPHGSTSTRARGSALRGAARPFEGTRTLIEEGTTNLVSNPEPQAKQGWWGGGLSGSSEIAPRPWDPLKLCLKRVSTARTTIGLGPITATTTLEVTAGATYTFSMTLMTEGDSGNVSLVTTGKNGSAGSISSFTPLNIVWHNRFLETGVPSRLSVTFTIPEGITHLTDLGFFAPNGDAGRALYGADAQFEQKPYATSYCDGSLGPLYSWTGTPHASPSVRIPSFSSTIPAGSGWLLEEGTKNLVRNPRGAIDTAHVSISSGGTLSRVVSPNLPAETGYRVTTPGTSVGTENLNLGVDNPSRVGVALDAPLTFALSFDLRWEYGSHLWAAFQWNNGPTTTLTAVSRTTTPTRHTVIATVPAGQTINADTCRLILFTRIGGTTGTAAAFEVSNLQVEEKPYATSYCDGSLGAGYSWTGTPHSSASLRAEAAIVHNTPETFLDPQTGSLAIKFWGADPVRSLDNYLLQIGHGNNAGTTNIRISVDNSKQLRVAWQHNGKLAASLVAGPIVTEQWNTVVVEWNGSEFSGTLNGGPKVTGTRDDPTTAPWGFAMYLGKAAWAPTNYNHPIAAFVAFPRTLTDHERQFVFDNMDASWDVLNEADGEVVVGYEPTTNLVANPAPAIPYHGAGNSTGAVVDAPNTPSGKASKHTIASAVTTAIVANPFTTGIGAYSYKEQGTHTYATELWVDDPAKFSFLRVSLIVAYTDATTQTALTTVRPTMTPQRIAVTINPDPAKTISQYYVYVYATTTAAGAVLYLSSTQFEKRPYATPYVDGSMPDAAWVGTAHSSPSVRAARGDVNYTKKALVRYIEDGQQKTSRLDGRAGYIGTKGLFETHDGSLRLRPNDGSTLEVEAVALYEHDVEQIEDKVAGIEDTWSVRNTTSVMDVPIKVPFIEEETTNLYRNPFALVDTTNGFTARGVTERDDRDGVTTGTCFKNTRTDPAGSFYFNTNGGATSGANVIPIDPTKPVTISCKVKAATGTKINLRAFTYNAARTAAVLGDDATITATGEWQEIVATRTPSTYQSDAESLAFYLLVPQAAVGDVVRVTDIQVEQKPHATSICPQLDEFGNLHKGYTWTGTPHSSPSTRSGSILYLGSPEKKLSPKQGAVVCRYRPRQGGINSRYVLGIGAPGRWFIPVTNGGSGMLQVYIRDPYGNQEPSLTIGPIEEGKWVTFMVYWDEETYGLITSSGHEGSRPRNYPTTESVFASDVFTVTSPNQQKNLEVASVLAFERPLTESERTKLFAMETWEWDKMQPVIGGSLRRKFNDPILVTKTSSV